MSERLGILEFKEPNLTASSHIGDLSVPSSPIPCSKGKTTKHVTFHDPLVNLAQPYSSMPSPRGLSSKRKTTSLQVSFSSNTHILKVLSTKTPSTTPSKPLHQPVLVHCIPQKGIIPLKSALKPQSTKATAPCSTSVVQNIMALKQAFPDSFNTIGNMSSTYIIRTNPTVSPFIMHSTRSQSSTVSK